MFCLLLWSSELWSPDYYSGCPGWSRHHQHHCVLLLLLLLLQEETSVKVRRPEISVVFSCQCNILHHQKSPCSLQTRRQAVLCPLEFSRQSWEPSERILNIFGTVFAFGNNTSTVSAHPNLHNHILRINILPLNSQTVSLFVLHLSGSISWNLSTPSSPTLCWLVFRRGNLATIWFIWSWYSVHDSLYHQAWLGWGKICPEARGDQTAFRGTVRT